MNWNNILETRCPLCNSKLAFRVKGTDIKFQEKYKGATKKDFYLCRSGDCTFTIAADKFSKVFSHLTDKNSINVHWESLKPLAKK
jgi:hypothetical protein